jgi:hypothetical protein
MTFHVDREMLVKRFFEDWTATIVGEDDFLLYYQDQYVVDMEIKQLNEQDEISYICKLYDAFPRSINIMALNNSAQSQTHRLTVMFAYRYWRGFLPNE